MIFKNSWSTEKMKFCVMHLTLSGRGYNLVNGFLFTPEHNCNENLYSLWKPAIAVLVDDLNLPAIIGSWGGRAVTLPKSTICPNTESESQRLPLGYGLQALLAPPVSLIAILIFY